MTTEQELKKIKKIYGEKFMHLCRELFSTILEKEGKLYEILSSSFSENCKTLYDDIVDNNLEYELKDYIYEKYDEIKQEKDLIDEKTPYELLEEAGYELIECETEEEIQDFKKYYEDGEELCTFRGGRLNTCIVFWAIKKDVENIKRENFKEPKREDEYGTSVMSIQFYKKGICTVSIKNRYNHHVTNPDATYGNDLDRIINGLTESFARLLKERGIILGKSNIEKLNIPGYKVVNGKYYKYNMEINGVYYCPGNIIIENDTLRRLKNPESQILIDYFVLDTKNKSIDVYDHNIYDENIRDSFIDGLQNIEKIEIRSNKGKRTRTITIYNNQPTNILIEIDGNNQIVGYTNNELTEAGDYFLGFNKKLSKFEAPKLARVGDSCLYWNEELEEFNAPELVEAGDNLLRDNKKLSKFEALKLVRVGDKCLCANQELEEFNAPELTEAGDNLLCHNEKLSKFEVPKLARIGDRCLFANQELEEFNAPELVEAGDNLLRDNKKLSKFEALKLVKVGDKCLFANQELKKFNAPELVEAGDNLLSHNKKLSKFQVPKLVRVGNRCLRWNKKLEEFNAPELVEAGYEVLLNNRKLSKFEAPKLARIGDYFLYWNERLIEFEAPKLVKIGKESLYHVKRIKKFNAPELTEVGDGLLYNDKGIHSIRSEEENLQTNITANDIAKLDNDNKISTSEINIGKRIINNLRNLFNKINNER